MGSAAPGSQLPPPMALVLRARRRHADQHQRLLAHRELQAAEERFRQALIDGLFRSYNCPPDGEYQFVVHHAPLQ